jgi:teichoic acid transport system ATP-binding protein
LLKLANIKLLGGSYYLDVGLFENTTIVALDYISRAIKFRIFNNSNMEGFVMLEHYWLNMTT